MNWMVVSQKSCWSFISNRKLFGVSQIGSHLHVFRKTYVICEFCQPGHHIYQCYKMMKLKLSSSFSLKTVPARCALGFSFTWAWFHFNGGLFPSLKGGPLLIRMWKHYMHWKVSKDLLIWKLDRLHVLQYMEFHNMHTILNPRFPRFEFFVYFKYARAPPPLPSFRSWKHSSVWTVRRIALKSVLLIIKCIQGRTNCLVAS